jgi:hypothetical protein
MWLRRSSSEITEIETRKRRKRFSPVGPLLITVVLALVEWVVRRGTPKPFDFTSPVPLLFIVIVFGLLYFSRIAFGRSFLFSPSPFSNFAKPNMICAQCGVVQPDTDSHRCSCGGILEPLDHWRWVEENRPAAPNQSLEPTAGPSR